MLRGGPRGLLVPWCCVLLGGVLLGLARDQPVRVEGVAHRRLDLLGLDLPDLLGLALRSVPCRIALGAWGGGVLGAWGGRAPRGAPGGAWRVLTRLAVRGTLALSTLALSLLARSLLARSLLARGTLARSALARPAHIVPALGAVLMCSGRSGGVHPRGPG